MSKNAKKYQKVVLLGMILEFSIANFRSIKERCTFSLEAEAGQSKADNYFDLPLSKDQNVRLLRSAVVYGANASGKTNLIKGINAFVRMIQTSNKLSIHEEIPYYEPFAFDEDYVNAPTEMEMIFALKGEDGQFIKHRYAFTYTASEILSEELEYYPKGQSHNLFKRITDGKKDPDAISHTGRLSKVFRYKEYPIFKNQLFLAKFGVDIPHEQLSRVFLFFADVDVWNTLDNNTTERLQNRVARDLLKPENAHLLNRINKLLRIADTKVESINIEEGSKGGNLYHMIINGEKRIVREAPAKIQANHIVYKKNEPLGLRQLDLKEESAGTKILFALGGIILKKLEKGGVIFFDEMDNSLHPKLSKFLVRLFNSNVSNPHNAQLIIATHEVTLLDKDVFRKDQIWFAEKNKYGATEIFSVKDFDGVREDTPFDKWYANGKFGGQPRIKELEFIFGNE